MAYEYVTQIFGKNFVVGQRVTHKHMGGGEVRPERPSSVNMIMVMIDGMPFSTPCDPWDLEIERKNRER